MPRSAGLQRTLQLGDQSVVHAHAGFEMQRLHLKNALLAMGFGIEPADQRIVVQNRQREVAILALGRGRIALDLIGEIEHSLRPRSIRHQWVERGQQGRPGDRYLPVRGRFKRTPLNGMEITGHIPAFDRHAL